MKFVKFKVGNIIRCMYPNSRNILKCKILNLPESDKHEYYNVLILDSKYIDSDVLGVNKEFKLTRNDEDMYHCDYGFSEDLESILKE